jgi:hypothetical protein
MPDGMGQRSVKAFTTRLPRLLHTVQACFYVQRYLDEAGAPQLSELRHGML